MNPFHDSSLVLMQAEKTLFKLVKLLRISESCGFDAQILFQVHRFSWRIGLSGQLLFKQRLHSKIWMPLLLGILELTGPARLISYVWYLEPSALGIKIKSFDLDWVDLYKK